MLKLKYKNLNKYDREDKYFMKNILYYAQSCPDTAPFKEKLTELEIDYEEVEILS